MSTLNAHPLRVLSILGVVVAAMLATAASALAAPVVDGEFQLTGQPQRLAAGPDGNVWVTLSGSSDGNEVARVGPDGAVQEFDVPALADAIGIVAGPDGRMWVTRSNTVAAFDPADPAGAEEFPALNIVQPQTIVAGPDGNLWTASADKAIRITTAGAVTDFTITGLDAARGTASSGGLLWVVDFADGQIFSLTPDGLESVPYAVGGNGPQEAVGGPGGQIAYGNPGTDPQTVGRLAAGGTPQTTPAPLADPFGVAFAPDGAYWFAHFATDDLGRLTPDGEYTTLAGLSAGSGPRYIAAGPGNTLWVALQTVNKVARVTGVEPAPTPQPQPDPPPKPPVDPNADPKPRILSLSVAPRAFRAGGTRTAVVARRGRGRGKGGANVRYALSEPAVVRFLFQRRERGRRAGGRCAKPTARLRRRGARPCRRWVRAGSLVRRGVEGANAFRFTGKLGRKPMPAGRYRITAVATDQIGQRSAPRRTGFRILR